TLRYSASATSSARLHSDQVSFLGGGAAHAQRIRQMQSASVPKCEKLDHRLTRWQTVQHIFAPSRRNPCIALRRGCVFSQAIALVRFAATLSRKPVVDSQRWSAPTSSARSLVIKPASTVST